MLKFPRTFRDKFHELALTAYARGRSNRKRYGFRAYSGKKENQRRFLQDAHQNQLNSHKPGTVQPFHIFGDLP